MLRASSAISSYKTGVCTITVKYNGKLIPLLIILIKLNFHNGLHPSQSNTKRKQYEMYELRNYDGVKMCPCQYLLVFLSIVLSPMVFTL